MKVFAASPSTPGSGFITGTRVHTDRGLVPIEAVRTGDLVLSRNLEAGTWELCEVLATQSNAAVELCFLNVVVDRSARAKGEDSYNWFLVLGTQQPVWFNGFAEPLEEILPPDATVEEFFADLDQRQSWRPASRFPDAADLASSNGLLLTRDGRKTAVEETSPLFRALEDAGSASECVAVIGDARFRDWGVGEALDLSNGVPHRVWSRDADQPSAHVPEDSDDPTPFGCDVFHLVVKGNRNFCVGTLGILVADASFGAGA